MKALAGNDTTIEKIEFSGNYILYDRLTGEQGTDSYELDLPNGGLSYVIGTVIEQGSNTQYVQTATHATRTDGGTIAGAFGT